jgi:hypothetical protein
MLIVLSKKQYPVTDLWKFFKIFKMPILLNSPRSALELAISVTTIFECSMWMICRTKNKSKLNTIILKTTVVKLYFIVLPDNGHR